MNAKIYKRIAQDQFDAALAMLEECVRACPTKHWRGTIGKYPCSKKVRASIKRETAGTLRGVSGFPWLLAMTRAELLIYNTRHVQHHAAQLGAFLRRKRVKTRWVKSGGR